MKINQSRICEITEIIDNWLEKWSRNSKDFDPNSFDFDSYFKLMKVNKSEAKKIKELYKNETADYDELARMPSDVELGAMSEYDRDQWLQLQEAYSHVTPSDIETYQTAVTHLLTAADKVIR